MPAIQGNSLSSRHSLRFPRTPGCAMISTRTPPCGAGPGHNATTISRSPVVPAVVGNSPCISAAYAIPQRHNAEKAVLTCVCVHVRARVCIGQYIRCAVVDIIYLHEIIAKKSTTQPTTPEGYSVVPVVPAVVKSPNSLEYNKKRGFYA